MAGQSDTDRLDNVAPGDIIALELPNDDLPNDDLPNDDGADVRQFKVVHKDSNGATIIITLEGDDGETCDIELPGDTVVTRSLESKWESEQSPTPHEGS
jgi:hypothetical protein